LNFIGVSEISLTDTAIYSTGGNQNSGNVGCQS
jgi:hypothetical protein